MSDKLKPCPFCGEPGECNRDILWYSHCSGGCFIGFHRWGKAVAIAAWNRRTPDARLEAERAVIVPEEGQSGCSEHWRPIDDDWSRDYWDEFDPFTRLDDAIRASRRRAK